MKKDKEYNKEVFERFHSGGTLWFFERTDTNEFQQLHLGIQYSNEPPVKDSWSKPINVGHLHKAYLTKEDAESEFRPPYYEEGCSYCGSGSVQIPVEIREHQFINKVQ